MKTIATKWKKFSDWVFQNFCQEPSTDDWLSDERIDEIARGALRPDEISYWQLRSLAHEIKTRRENYEN